MKHYTPIVIVTLLTLGAGRTGVAQAAGSTDAPDTARVAWAKHLLVSLRVADALREGMDSEFAEQRRANPRIPAVFYDTLGVRLTRVVPDLVDSLAVIYARELSLDDLKALDTFFQSPLGQRYSKAQSPIQLHSKEVAQRWGLRLAMSVMKDLVDEGLIHDLPQ